MEIIVANESNEDLWLEFIDRMRPSNHAHAWAWRKIISNSFGHTPYYLLARAKGTTRGVLPLFFVKSLIFGRALISVPYINGGGILAEDREAEDSLIRYAMNLSRSLCGSYLELRHRDKKAFTNGSLQTRQHKVSMLLDLHADPLETLAAFPGKLRSQIRRPEKSGATVSAYSGYDAQAVDEFYTVFTENMRDLGTPVYPKRLFFLTTKLFGSKAKIIIVYKGTKPVAAGITIGSNNSTEILWGSSLRSENSYSPNMMMYWEAIKHSCLDGYTYFDFGRTTPGSPTHRFKEQWGSKPLELFWHYYVVKGELPEVNPKNEKFRLMVKAWQKLPLSVANSLGPWLTRSLP